jgi:hypothetical protein
VSACRLATQQRRDFSWVQVLAVNTKCEPHLVDRSTDFGHHDGFVHAQKVARFVRPAMTSWLVFT